MSVPSVNPAETASSFLVDSYGHLNFLKFKKELNSCDALVFGGGGLLQDETGIWNLPFHLSRISAARKQGLPWVGIGLGASGLTSHRSLKQVAVKLRGHLGVSVRDETSARILESLKIPNVVRASDLGWMFDVSDSTNPVSSQGVIGISLRNPQSSRLLPAAIGPKVSFSERETLGLAKAIDSVAVSTGLNVRFISLNSDDTQLHRQVANKMRVTCEVSTPDLENLEKCFNDVEVVVTMRYHAGLMGALKGAAVVSLPFSKKLDSLTSGLGSAASKATIENLVPVVESVLAGRSELNEHVESLKALSNNNVEIIDLLDGIK